MKTLPTKTLRLMLCVFLLACAVALATVPWTSRLETDVLALLADDHPHAGASLFREVLTRQGQSLAILVEGPDAGPVAAQLAERLAGLETVAAAAVAGEEALAPLGGVLFSERMQLLFPRWLAGQRADYADTQAAVPFEVWLARRAAQALEIFLATPESMAFAPLVPEDPLLLLPSAMLALPQPESGTGRAFVLVELAVPPTHPRAAPQLRAAIEAQRRADPGHAFQAAGAVFFAHGSESAIRSDVLRMNLLMTGLLGLIVALVLRSLRAVITVAIPVLLAAAGAVALTAWTHTVLHTLALGIAGILCGIALDYPIHVLLHRHMGEAGYAPSARRVAKPLAVGCLSTVAVFLFLLLSGQGLLRQVGLLVGSGLLLAGVLTVPAMLALPPRGEPSQGVLLLSRGRLRCGRVGPSIVACVMLLLTLGVFKAQWRDSMDVFHLPLPGIEAEAAAVEAALGTGSASRRVITVGTSLADALAKVRDVPSRPGLHNIPATLQEAADAAAWWTAQGRAFKTALDAELDERGFDSSAFTPLTVGDTGYEQALADLQAALPPGLHWTVGEADGSAWIIHDLDRDVATLPPHTLPFSPRSALDAAFGSYREDTLRLAGWGFGTAAVIVLLTNGLRRGLRVIAVPVLAVGATVGAQGWLGLPMNLFHLVGLLLGFGLSLDYALFTLRVGGARVSVRFSALTTLVAFGALATSGIPAVAGLGLTVFMVVAGALLLCELISGHDTHVAEATAPQATRPALG